MDYSEFLYTKIPEAQRNGFAVDESEINPMAFPHQRDTIRWGILGGRRAVFASFGLGKSLMQLEMCRIILQHEGGKALIVCPLGVRQEFAEDARKLTEYAEANGLDVAKFGITLEYVTTTEQALASKATICITNYERVRDGGIDPTVFTVASLDEASVLRGYGTKTFQEFLQKFPRTKYRHVCTATPAPNRFKELIHYSGFLGVLDTGEALTRFFQRDSEKAGNLTLYPHKEREFWLWMTTWALFITRPSDLGYSDLGYDLPELRMHYHKVDTEGLARPVKHRDVPMLFEDTAMGLQDASIEKRISIPARMAKVREILEAEPSRHFILWHDLESERAVLEKIKGCKSIYGSQDLDLREELTLGFAYGKYQYLATKPKISGSGCNFQRFCSAAIFTGITYKFNDFIQSCHRVLRFGQTEAVDIHVIYTDTEEHVLNTLKEKWANHITMVKNMTDIVKQYGLAKEAISSELGRTMGLPRHVSTGENWTAVNNDCVEECKLIESDSVDLIHTSIPFGNHYEYSPSYNDFGHNKGNVEFFAQMDFLTPNLLRILKPGRVAAIHVKDRILFGNVTGMGMPTLDPFHVFTIMHYIKHGFAFFGMVTIETDVVRENNQTYRLGWTEQCKDGSKMGVGCPEYLLMFRKLPTDTSTAYADEPVRKSKEDYTRGQWQIDARAKWNSSGNSFITSEELAGLDMDVIGKKFNAFFQKHIYNYKDHVSLAMAMDKAGRLPATFELFKVPARNQECVWSDVNRMRTLNTEQTRRNLQNHICPLSWDIVDRVINRYSNKDELVFDPFGGLMTVPYRAVKLGRKGYGVELNPDYWRDGLGYLQACDEKIEVPSLFDSFL